MNCVHRASTLPTLLLAAALTACADGPAAVEQSWTRTATISRIERPPRPTASPDRLLSCSWSAGASASAVIGADGGTLVVDGHVVRIARGSVREPTLFTVSTPAGRLLALTIEVSAGDAELSAAPVEATITYARCQRQDVARRVLSVRLIEGGMDASTLADGLAVEADEDPETRTIDFLVVQRGTYAVAY